MSVALNRILSRDEEVDHIDGDKQNDSMDNLEIVSREENKKRHVRLHPKKMLRHTCPVCNTVFERDRQRSYQSIAKGKKLTCSRRCGGIKSKK